MRISLLIFSLLLITACKDIEGSYAPWCAAFEGETVELRGGEFVWDRFTDALEVGADGKVVDPFPGFPKTGSYSVDGSSVALRIEGAGETRHYTLVSQPGQLFLLNVSQLNRYTSGGGIDECALVQKSGVEN